VVSIPASWFVRHVEGHFEVGVAFRDINLTSNFFKIGQLVKKFKEGRLKDRMMISQVYISLSLRLESILKN
jgi:hypothetical protein